MIADFGPRALDRSRKTDAGSISECSPAEGIGAAVEKQDFGPSRWQLSHQATPLAWCAEASRRVGKTKRAHRSLRGCRTGSSDGWSAIP
jgi:hypothetical protein